MAFAKSLKKPQSFRLDLSNTNLNITTEQFECLRANNPDLDLALTEDGQLLLTAPETIDEPLDVLEHQSKTLRKEDLELAHGLDGRESLLSGDVKNLYWDINAYNYIQEQEEKFKDCLPELISQYGGQYIIFESGLILDSDTDEMTLLIRISENLSYRDRPAIFCKFVPLTLDVDKVSV